MMRKPPNTLRSFGPSINAPALYCPAGPLRLPLDSNCWLRYPHSPSSVTTYRESVTTPRGLVSFARLSFAVGPSQDVSALLQLSCVGPDDWETAVCVRVGDTSEVGDVMGVSVGTSVGLGVSVGGGNVAAGIASSV